MTDRLANGLAIGERRNAESAAKAAAFALDYEEFRTLVEYAASNGTTALKRWYNESASISGDATEASDAPEGQQAGMIETLLDFLCHPVTLSVLSRAAKRLQGRAIYKYIEFAVLLLSLWCRHRNSKPSRPSELVATLSSWAKSGDDADLNADLDARDRAIYLVAKALCRNVFGVHPNAESAAVDPHLARAEGAEVMALATRDEDIRAALGSMMPPIYVDPDDNLVTWTTAMAISMYPAEMVVGLYGGVPPRALAQGETVPRFSEALFHMQRVLRGEV